MKLDSSFGIEEFKNIDISFEYKDNKGWSWNESGEGYRIFRHNLLSYNF